MIKLTSELLNGGENNDRRMADEASQILSNAPSWILVGVDLTEKGLDLRVLVNKLDPESTGIIFNTLAEEAQRVVPTPAAYVSSRVER